MTEPSADVKRVVHCLRRNPLWESDEILADRAERLGLDRFGDRDAHEQARDKALLASRLQEVRRRVWDAAPDTLAGELEGLDLSHHRDLAPLAERLRTIVASREAVASVESAKGFDQEFFDCFKTVLSGTPRERSQTRQAVINAFRNRGLRRRGGKTLRLLRQVAPELCALEADWIKSLSKYRLKFTLASDRRSTIAAHRDAAPTERREERSGCASTWLWLFAAYLIIKALVLIGASR